MLPLFLVLTSLALIGLLLALIQMIQVVRSIPHIGPDSVPWREGPYPRVSVIVPARNEEHRIEGCLSTLLTQDYPALEIRVVDDCSTDRTGDIVREMAARDDRIVPVQGREPPPGWLGKPHAISQGTRDATGEYLCFVDADGRLHPQCIRQTVESIEAHGADLLTLGMRLECEKSFWERAIQPLVIQLILMFFPADKVNDPREEVASANGPYLLFRRSAYEAMGGHAAVRAEIVEDLVIAKRVKEMGMRLLWVLGPELMSIRMYASLREIWEGWSKNFFKSMDERVSLAALAALGIGWLFLLPWLSAGWAVWQLLAGPGRLLGFSLFALSAATLLAHLAQRRWIEAHYGVMSGSVYLQPLGALVLIGIVINSTVRTRWGGRIRWKGRTYRGGEAAP